MNKWDVTLQGKGSAMNDNAINPLDVLNFKDATTFTSRQQTSIITNEYETAIAVKTKWMERDNFLMVSRTLDSIETHFINGILC